MRSPCSCTSGAAVPQLLITYSSRGPAGECYRAAASQPLLASDPWDVENKQAENEPWQS